MKIRTSLLFCGFSAPIIFILTDLLAGTRWQGYDFFSQSISELGAIGAPTRSLVIVMNLIYYGLVAAFAAGTLSIAGKNVPLKILAGLLLVHAFISAFTLLFYPMHVGIKATLGSVHVTLMMTAVFSFTLAIVIGIFAFADWFRILSIGIILTLIVLTLLGIFLFPQLGISNLPSTGIQERVMVFGFHLWMAALAVHFFQIEKAKGNK